MKLEDKKRVRQLIKIATEQRAGGLLFSFNWGDRKVQIEGDILTRTGKVDLFKKNCSF